MKEPQVNNYILNIYKKILFTKLKNSQDWELYTSNYNYLKSNEVDNTKKLKFEISIYNRIHFEIKIIINSREQFKFDINYFDYKLCKQIMKCKKNVQFNDNFKDISNIENKLLDCIDDDLKRRFKIEKLKRNIK